MTIPIRKNTAQIITVGPFLDKTDGVTPELSLTVTGCHITLVADTADGNAPTLVIDADATASGGDNDLVHVTNDNAGYYSLELTAAQTNRNGHGRLCINDDDVHCPVFHDVVFLEANVFDSLYGTDILQVDLKQILGTTLTETVGGYLAAAFKKLFDVETPVFTAQSVNQTGDSYAKVDSEIAAMDGKIDIIDSNLDAVKAKTDMQPAVWYSP